MAKKCTTIMAVIKENTGFSAAFIRYWLLGEAFEPKATQEAAANNVYFVGTTNPSYWSNLVKGDYFTKSNQLTAVEHLSDEKKWIEAVKDKINPIKKPLIERMIESLKTDKFVYSLQNPNMKSKETDADNSKGRLSEKKPAERRKSESIGETVGKNAPKASLTNDAESLVAYNRADIKYLLKLYESINLEDTENEFRISDALYQTVYLAVLKALPVHDFLKKDMDEYEIEITNRYPNIVGPNGQRALYRLAKSGNRMANLQLGELYYNGVTGSHKKDYEYAYKCYEKAVQKDPLEIGSVSFYPWAYWNYAYMNFNYKFRGDLKNAPIIVSLAKYSHHERTKVAVKYCLDAVENYPDFSPAFNLLGVILDIIEKESFEGFDEYADIREFIEESASLDLCERLNGAITPESLFEYAANNGSKSIEALNNLWKIETSRAFLAKNPDEEKKHLEKSIEYLQTAASRGSTWACNRLGLFFDSGIMTFKFEETGKEESRDYSESYKSQEKAIINYINGISQFSDIHSAWSAYNLRVIQLREMEKNQGTNILSSDIEDKCDKTVMFWTNNPTIREKYKDILEQKAKLEESFE